MFKPEANYFTIVSIEHPHVVKEFTGLPFLENIQLQYPSSEDENLVMNACYEVLGVLTKIKGVSLKRIPNSIHYGYDETAEEMDVCIIEKHDILYDDNSVGTLAVCAEGRVYEITPVLQ